MNRIWKTIAENFLRSRCRIRYVYPNSALTVGGTRKIGKKTFKMRSFWVPPGVIFWCFSRALVFHRIFVIFRWKNYKHEKSRSASRYVNCDVSWGSPGWKKWEKLWIFALKKPSIFHWTWTQYRVKKMSQTKCATKISQSTSPVALCRSMGQFLVKFEGPRASQDGPKWTGDFDKNHFKSFLGPPWDHLGRLIALFCYFGSILVSF